MSVYTTIHVIPDHEDLAKASVRVDIHPDGTPVARIAIDKLTLSTPLSESPITLAEFFENAAATIRSQFADWLATPASDAWCEKVKAKAIADATPYGIDPFTGEPAPYAIDGVEVSA